MIALSSREIGNVVIEKEVNFTKHIFFPMIVGQIAMISNLMLFGLEDMTAIIYYVVIMIPFVNNPVAIFSLFLTPYFSFTFYTANLGFYEFEFRDGFDTATDFENAGFLIMSFVTFSRGLLNTKFTVYHKWLMTFGLYIIINTVIWAVYDSSIQEAFRYINFFLLFLVTYAFVLTRFLVTYFLAFFLYLSAFAVLLLFAFITSNPDTVSEYQAGSSLLFVIPFLITIYHLQLQKKIKLVNNLLLLLIIGAGIYLLLMTNSRRFFMASVFFVGFIFLRNINLVASLRYTAVMSLMVVLWINGSLDTLLPTSIGERLDNTRTALETYQEKGEFGDYRGEFYNQRDELLSIAFELIEDHWLFGVGYFGTDEYIGEKLDSKARVHNFFIQMVSDNGIVGLILYLGFAGTLLIHVIRFINHKKTDTVTKSFCTAFIIYFLASNVLSTFGMHLIFNKNEWLYYGIILGIVFQRQQFLTKEQNVKLNPSINHAE